MNRLEGWLGGVEYHQFYLAGELREFPSYPMEGAPNRLLATTDTGTAVCVTTGIAMGMVELAIEFLDDPPSAVDESHDWEAVTEVCFEATDTTAAVVLLMTETDPPFDTFELPHGPGWYRLRGHAAGRSLDYDSVVLSDPREHHLLKLWPGDRRQDALTLREDDPWERQGAGPHGG